MEKNIKFDKEESIMVEFINLCQPSLDPDSYEEVIKVCEMLCDNRNSLAKGSLDKCLQYLKTLSAHSILEKSVLTS